MYRSDGYRVRTSDAMYEIVPYIMPKRFDASNSIKVDIDLDRIQEYIKSCRRSGIQMSHMSIIIAGYLRLVSQNPYLNRFAMNKKIYARNHFCVSFVTLTPGKDSDTVNKVYFNLDDTIFTVNDKINAAITKSQQADMMTAMDQLASKLLRIPFLMRGAVGFLKFLDKYFTMPFGVVHASPFHTSLFLTNLASIRTDTIYHHLYEFGTTGIFISMGQPVKKTFIGENDEVMERKVMELGIVTDERIANGHYFGTCFRELNKYYKDPSVLENPPETIAVDPHVRKKNRKWILK